MLAEDLELQRALALRAVTGGLLRLRWLAAATRFELAMHRHMRALKYGYNLDQPRAGISIRGMELLPRSLKGSHRAIT
jgi:hypothetical protein